MSETAAVVVGKPPVVFSFSCCPACNRTIAQVESQAGTWLILPRVGMRRPIHPSVPSEVRDDYDQAALVLNDSPKASAALSRRCLQTLLTLKGSKKRDLLDQLDELYGTLPGYVQGYVDNIRKLGNLSAHAKQSIATGAIVEVEPGEAEWMLELLEELFDHYYAKPAEAQIRQAALAKKFADAGPLKPR